MPGQWKIELNETSQGVGTGRAEWWEDSTKVDTDPADFSFSRSGLGNTTAQRNAFLSDCAERRDEWQLLESRRAAAVTLAASWTTTLNTNDPKATP